MSGTALTARPKTHQHIPLRGQRHDRIGEMRSYEMTDQFDGTRDTSELHLCDTSLSLQNTSGFVRPRIRLCVSAHQAKSAFTSPEAPLGITARWVDIKTYITLYFLDTLISCSNESFKLHIVAQLPICPDILLSDAAGTRSGHILVPEPFPRDTPSNLPIWPPLLK